MDRSKLIAALNKQLPSELAEDMTNNFLILRQDMVTGTLGRSAPGKFVETLVQILQFLESGTYENNPKVDGYLLKLESRSTTLDDGLKICATRIGRAMYTLRNKRNIAHEGSVDPNGYDLQFLHGASQWILAELIRTVSGVSMGEAGKLVEQIQVPAGGLIEDFGERKLVLKDLTVKEEILVLLHSYYPSEVSTANVVSSMSRRSSGTVRNSLRTLWGNKLLEGNGATGYKLTQRGLTEAIGIVKRYTEVGAEA